jgi:hypothetical protein
MGIFEALQRKQGAPGVSPAEAMAALQPQSRAARRANNRTPGTGYHAPRHRTGRPTFSLTPEQEMAAHVEAGGCDRRTKKGGLCQVRPMKGTSTCKVHTAKVTADA